MNQEDINQSIKGIKHQFMTYRNGMVADALRQVYNCYDVIFGLQLPDLSRIAADLPKDKSLASALFNDKRVRESRLLSFHLFPHDSLAQDEVMKLILEINTPEEADIIAFRLLRFLPYAEKLIEYENENGISENSKRAFEMLRNHLTVMGRI